MGWIHHTTLGERDWLPWPENTLFSASPLLFLIISNTARLILKKTWMITFIISHNEHSSLSCDAFHSDRCVPASDKLQTTPHQIFCQPKPRLAPPFLTTLLPSPMSAGLRADWQHLSSSLFLFIRFCIPPPLTVWGNITPYYPFFIVTAFNCITNSHTNQCWEYAHTHSHCWRDPATLMVIVCRLCHWWQNSLQAF